ncbi:hypothetical protein [Roseovarius aestuarii]|nr:hypothetical protein [Roseovarius aestuarii]
MLATILAVGTEAGALTLTFNNSSNGLTTQTEQGFAFQNSVPYNPGNVLYLHDDGGIITSTFSRQNGQRFNVLGGSFSGYSLLYKAVSGAHPAGNSNLEYYYNGQLSHLAFVPDLYYSVQGYRSGQLVAQVTQLATIAGNVGWGRLFSNIDQFRLSLLLPNNRTTYAPRWPGGGAINLPYAPGNYFCNEWCGGLQLDNLKIAPVPLPAALPLLALVLMGLGFIGWLRRRMA